MGRGSQITPVDLYQPYDNQPSIRLSTLKHLLFGGDGGSQLFPYLQRLYANIPLSGRDEVVGVLLISWFLLDSTTILVGMKLFSGREVLKVESE